MADVSHPLLSLSEQCYRGSTSPRSASTPGPSAPDSPASSAGRFSASPSTNSYYSPYHHHPAAAMGLMGSFLSVGPYGPYAALAAAAMAGQFHAATPSGLMPSVPFINRLAAATTATSRPQPVSRVLPFSVENILKPEFGRVQPQSTSGESHSVEMKPAVLSAKEAIKRPAASALPIQPPSNKKVKTVAGPTTPPTSAAVTKIKPDPADGRSSSCTDFSDAGSNSSKDTEHQSNSNGPTELPTDPTKMTDPSKWPAWIFCTRYSDRPSSGPRSRRTKKDRKAEEKRPRTAFTSEQLARLKNEFNENRYLNEKRRQELANELQLHENQIKIWFQNKRAKIKKTTGSKNPLALQLMAQGLYNHSTVSVDEDEDEDCFNRPPSEHHSD